MKCSGYLAWPIVFLVLGISSLSNGQAPKKHNVEESCRVFVQRFYDYYVTQMIRSVRRGEAIFPWFDATKHARFNPELARQIQEYHEASANSTGTNVGLDFDPFTGGKNFFFHYVTGATKIAPDGCSVEILGVEDTRVQDKPAVVVELTIAAGKWEFANFHYPGIADDGHGSNDLLGILKMIREKRK